MTVYVRSSATGLNNGTSWTNAYTAIASALATTDPDIWVASDHVEGHTGSDLILDWTNATALNPFEILSINPVDDSYARGALLNADANRVYLGSQSNWNGIIFSGDNRVQVSENSQVVIEDCAMRITGTAGSDRINLNSANAHLIARNSTMRFGASNQGISWGLGGSAEFTGMSIEPGGVAPANILDNIASGGGQLTFTCCNFSGMANGGFFSGDIGVSTHEGDGISLVRVSELTLPTNGQLMESKPRERGWRIEAYNFTNGSTNWIQHVEDNYGDVVDDTAIYRRGTYDGTNRYSLRVTSTVATRKWIGPIRCALAGFFAPANAELTFEITYDRANKFQNDELWVEVGSRAGLAVTRPATIRTAASNLAASSATWTRPAWTNPQTDKIEITLTNPAGWVQPYICFAPESVSSVYVCPQTDIAGVTPAERPGLNPAGLFNLIQAPPRRAHHPLQSP